MLAIGAKILDRPKDLEVAIKLGETCYWIYNSTSTGIGPEEFVFIKKGDTLGSNINALYSQWDDNVLPHGIYRMSGNYLLRPGMYQNWGERLRRRI
jgi:mannosyl-oligosaccharide alpha-1,2-mannosidase